ncbi:unnamed protein product [Absidia cylindrospora]
MAHGANIFFLGTPSSSTANRCYKYSTTTTVGCKNIVVPDPPIIQESHTRIVPGGRGRDNTTASTDSNDSNTRRLRCIITHSECTWGRDSTIANIDSGVTFTANTDSDAATTANTDSDATTTAITGRAPCQCGSLTINEQLMLIAEGTLSTNLDLHQ